jgi:hypothetical protein
MIKVFLDDIRVPKMSHNETRGLGMQYSNTKDWVIIRDYFDFIDFVKNNFDKIDLISFDHDLACYKDGQEFTGKNAVDYLINFCLDNDKPFPDWYAHTDNTTGRKNIISTILNYLNRIEGKDISNFRYFHNGIVNDKAV